MLLEIETYGNLADISKDLTERVEYVDEMSANDLILELTTLREKESFEYHQSALKLATELDLSGVVAISQSELKDLDMSVRDRNKAAIRQNVLQSLGLTLIDPDTRSRWRLNFNYGYDWRIKKGNLNLSCQLPLKVLELIYFLKTTKLLEYLTLLIGHRDRNGNTEYALMGGTSTPETPSYLLARWILGENDVSSSIQGNLIKPDKLLKPVEEIVKISKSLGMSTKRTMGLKRLFDRFWLTLGYSIR